LSLIISSLKIERETVLHDLNKIPQKMTKGIVSKCKENTISSEVMVENNIEYLLIKITEIFK
jgi:hypothetical protein